MRRLTLVEYKRSLLQDASAAEALALARIVPSMRIEPSAIVPGAFDAVPGATVGVVSLGDLEVVIRPKIAIERLLFMVSYAVDPACWTDDLVTVAADASVVEAVAPVFVRLVMRATSRGLLHGYRQEEQALATVRGQIRFADQVRERFGLLPPVEVRFDDFTPDIEENRRLRAALERLGRLRLRSPRVARSLREISAAFQAVRLCEYHPRQIDEVPITRLNRHYQPALRLADMILRACSLELGVGATTATAFLMNMNEVFEVFIHRALCEALRTTDGQFRRGDGTLRLDRARRVRLEPDLSWWVQGRCVFVGDAKYKQVEASGILHPDLYQLLAYTVAADLPSGALVYAAGEGEPAVHDVVFCGKRLHVVGLNLASSPHQVLSEIAVIARNIVAWGALPNPHRCAAAGAE